MAGGRGPSPRVAAPVVEWDGFPVLRVADGQQEGLPGAGGQEEQEEEGEQEEEEEK